MINPILKFKNKFKYLTIKDLKTFSLQKNNNTKIILILENKYFDLVKINIETDLDETERELVIEKELEERILNYCPIDFIEKEILLEEVHGSQKLLIILIKREIIKNIINDYIKKMDFYSLIPFFLIKNTETITPFKTIIFDFCENRVLFSILFDNKIIDIESYLIEKDEILANEIERNNLIDKINNILEKFENINSFLFFHKDIEIKNIIYEKIAINNIDEIAVSEMNDVSVKSLNFLPHEYMEEIKSKHLKKFIFSFILLFLMIEMIYFTFSILTENKKQGIINLQNKEINLLTKNISDNKEAAEKIDDYQDKIDYLKKLMGIRKTTFTDILIKLEYSSNKNIDIKVIEYKENHMMQITGNSNSDVALYDFIEKIDQDALFNNINHDYIKNVDDYFQFQFDMGVKID
ncbi:PilN domain-containing protein [Fusobacterium sp. PH5-44]|uniref:PilN domain-containing protein n=1 Tax=unclassified Fusobacterium TaxID=2648384 RepID=UPI003D19DDC7